MKLREDIIKVGKYKIGLTSEEIDQFLKIVSKKKHIKRLRKKFNGIAGVNTMGVSPHGEPLMYRYDVLRFTLKLLYGFTTYFD